MATKARELARHFETHGTPVMIGRLCHCSDFFFDNYTEDVVPCGLRIFVE